MDEKFCAVCGAPIIEVGDADATTLAFGLGSMSCLTCGRQVHKGCYQAGQCLHCQNNHLVRTAGRYCDERCGMLADQIGRCRHYCGAPRLDAEMTAQGVRFLRCQECMTEFPTKVSTST